MPTLIDLLCMEMPQHYFYCMHIIVAMQYFMSFDCIITNMSHSQKPCTFVCIDCELLPVSHLTPKRLSPEGCFG